MCSTLRKPIAIAMLLGSQQTWMVPFYRFISEGVVWLHLTGNPAGVGAMGIAGIAYAVLFVFFFTLVRLRT